MALIISLSPELLVAANTLGVTSEHYARLLVEAGLHHTHMAQISQPSRAQHSDDSPQVDLAPQEEW